MAIRLFSPNTKPFLTIENDKILDFASFKQTTEGLTIEAIVPSSLFNSLFAPSGNFRYFALVDFLSLSIPAILTNVKVEKDSFYTLKFSGIESFFDNVVFFGKPQIPNGYTSIVEKGSSADICIAQGVGDILAQWVRYVNSIISSYGKTPFLSVDLPKNESGALTIFSFDSKKTKLSSPFEQVRDLYFNDKRYLSFDFTGTNDAFGVTLRAKSLTTSFEDKKRFMYEIVEDRTQKKEEGSVLTNIIPGDRRVIVSHETSTNKPYKLGNSQKSNFLLSVKTTQDVFAIGTTIEYKGRKLICTLKELLDEGHFAYNFSDGASLSENRASEILERKKALEKDAASVYGEGIIYP